MTLDNGKIIWKSAPLSRDVWQLWMGPTGQSASTPVDSLRYEMMTPARWPNALFSTREVFQRLYWGVIDHHDSEHHCMAPPTKPSTCPLGTHGLIVDDGTDS